MLLLETLKVEFKHFTSLNIIANHKWRRTIFICVISASEGSQYNKSTFMLVRFTSIFLILLDVDLRNSFRTSLVIEMYLLLTEIMLCYWYPCIILLSPIQEFLDNSEYYVISVFVKIVEIELIRTNTTPISTSLTLLFLTYTFLKLFSLVFNLKFVYV